MYWTVAYEEGCEYSYYFHLWAMVALLSAGPASDMVFQALEDTVAADPRWEGHIDVLECVAGGLRVWLWEVVVEVVSELSEGTRVQQCFRVLPNARWLI